jgi:hypothetical protein
MNSGLEMISDDEEKGSQEAAWPGREGRSALR